jgi:hypothetical protein
MQPDLILIPFGKNATPGTIDPIPKTRGPGDEPQQATWDEGFPQVTMTPLAAGGIPPKGQDFNGVLKAISEHTVFTEHGGQYKWSSAYVAQSGGYSISDVVQADDGLNSYVSLVDSNTANFNTTPASIGTSWALYAGRNTQTMATETVAGISKRSTQALAEAGVDDTTSMTPLKTKQSIAANTSASTDGIAGSHSNLKVSATGLSALVVVTADAVCVKNPAFAQKVLNAISLSVNLAGSGANGLDTGVSAASTWYSVWAIWNGTTVAGLLSLSATAPTMPAGYTYKARIGWARSDATANKFPLPFIQVGASVDYKVVIGSNLTVLPLIASATTPTGSWTAAGISSVFPPTAFKARLKFYMSQTAPAAFYIAPNNQLAAIANAPAQFQVGFNSTGNMSLAQVFEMSIESTNMYYQMSGTPLIATVHAYGWEDSL